MLIGKYIENFATNTCSSIMLTTEEKIYCCREKYIVNVVILEKGIVAGTFIDNLCPLNILTFYANDFSLVMVRYFKLFVAPRVSF